MGMPTASLCPLGPKEGEARESDPEAEGTSVTRTLSPKGSATPKAPRVRFSSCDREDFATCCTFTSGPVRLAGFSQPSVAHKG